MKEALEGRESVIKDLQNMQSRMINKQGEVDTLSQGKKTFKQRIKSVIGNQKNLEELMKDIEDVIIYIYFINFLFSVRKKSKTSGCS